jgi:hypothetical protein
MRHGEELVPQAQIQGEARGHPVIVARVETSGKVVVIAVLCDAGIHGRYLLEERISGEEKRQRRKHRQAVLEEIRLHGDGEAVSQNTKLQRVLSLGPIDIVAQSIDILLIEERDNIRIKSSVPVKNDESHGHVGVPERQTGALDADRAVLIIDIGVAE